MTLKPLVFLNALSLRSCSGGAVWAVGLILVVGMSGTRFASAQPVRTSAEPKTVGVGKMEELFLSVWNTVEQRFYRQGLNGVDWEKAKRDFLPKARAAKSPEELSEVINAMLDLLHTSHTHFYTSQDVEYYYLLDLFARGMPEIVPKRFEDGIVTYTGIGIFTTRIGGDYFIVGAIDGGPAADAFLHRGNRIVSVDGEPFQPIRSFHGKAGKSVKVVVQLDAEGTKIQTYDVIPRTIEPKQEMMQGMEKSMRLIEHRGKQYAYVHVWSYAGVQYHDRLISELFDGTFLNADGLVLDLRDGWGGASPNYLNLFNQNVPRVLGENRNASTPSFDQQWRRPVALIVNDGTRSGKELLAYGFREYGIGPVVGTKTAGAVVAGTAIRIGDDALLYLAVSGISVDGKILEGVGVSPTIDVPMPLPYAPAQDPQLEGALDALR